MSSEWAAVDDLVRELGSVRSAADSIQVSRTSRAVVEQAIADAAEAVNRTIDRPRHPEALMLARDALGVAEEVLLAMNREVGRSLRIRARGASLRERAAALIKASQE